MKEPREGGYQRRRVRFDWNFVKSSSPALYVSVLIVNLVHFKPVYVQKVFTRQMERLIALPYCVIWGNLYWISDILNSVRFRARCCRRTAKAVFFTISGLDLFNPSLWKRPFVSLLRHLLFLFFLVKQKGEILYDDFKQVWWFAEKEKSSIKNRQREGEHLTFKGSKKIGKWKSADHPKRKKKSL